MIQYLEEDYKKIYKSITRNNIVIDEIEKFLKKLEEEYLKLKEIYVCFNHIAEVYYYEYFINHYKYNILEMNICNLYKILGKEYEKRSDLLIAENYYLKALKWNPVDLEVIFSSIELYKKMGKLDKVFSLSIEAYNYCCTRAELARLYRNFGYYYLEKYQPELSEMLYMYSGMFYETESAEKEIHFLETALKRKRSNYDIKEIQQQLKKEKIPIKASPITLALTYKAAENERKNGRNDIARECYMMVYDLTNDKCIKDILMDLR